MLEAQVPKDIRRFETKLVGPFTLRQLIFAVIAAVIAYVVYKVTKSVMGSDSALIITMIAISPPVAFGWVKPYGMTLENFLRVALVSNLIAPKERKYKTKNSFRVAEVKLDKMSSKEYKARMKKEKKLSNENLKYESYK